MGPKDFLDKLKWHPDLNLEQAEIVILHRGAPRDRIVVGGKDIQDLGSGFMTVRRDDKSVKIPYHRILEITSSSGEVVWKKSLE